MKPPVCRLPRTGRAQHLAVRAGMLLGSGLLALTGCSGRTEAQPPTTGIGVTSETTTSTIATSGPQSSTTTVPEPETGTQPDPGSSLGSDLLAASPDGVVALDIEVVATHPHDPAAYTQGLEMVDGLLLESTGLRGESTIRLVEPTTGEVVRSTPLEPDHFGEGTTVVGDEIWQLTWQSETLLVRGLDDLGERRRIPYRGEGWGLCATADHLVMSNGSSQLTHRDPTTFALVDTVTVQADGEPVGDLNELECAQGLVWANIFLTTRLVAIEATTGRVVAEADLTPLVPPGFEGHGNNVANGIAHDPTTGRFWLTGKRWPVMYEVELTPAP